MRAHGRALAAVAALLAPPLASAHDFWLERAGEGLVLRYGHRGGELLAIDRGKVKSVRCLDRGATRDLLGAAAFAPKEVMLAGPCGAASAFLDGGNWSLTPDGEVNQPKNQAPSAGATLGDELELVAVSDVSKAHQGDKVTVRLLHQGHPAANGIVAIDHKPLAETDSAGEARIKLRSSGVETISATLRRKVATPEADAEVLEASLSFEVAK